MIISDQTVSIKDAALWRRLAAMVYDSIVIIAIWIIVGFIVLSAFGIDQAQIVENDHVVMDPYYRLTLFSSMLLSAYLFFAWFWTHSGQTLGMQAWKIRIQNTDRSAISYKQSLIRCVIAPFSFLFYWIPSFIFLTFICSLIQKSSLCMTAFHTLWWFLNPGIKSPNNLNERL